MKDLTEYEQLKLDRDWFARTTWFKYFWEKLKNMLLNFVYKLYTSIEDILLKNYLMEIEFYTPLTKSIKEYNKKEGTHHLGEFKCYFPLILKVKNYEESLMVMNQIIKMLQESGMTISHSSISDEFVTPQMLDSKIERLRNQFKSVQFETISFETRTLKPTSEEKKDVLHRNYSVRNEVFKYKTVKIRPDNSYKYENYPIIIIEKTNTTE